MRSWVYNPHAGGRPVPPGARLRIQRRIQGHAEANCAGRFNRLDVRFRGAFCYIDAYIDPPPAEPVHLCRLRYSATTRHGASRSTPIATSGTSRASSRMARSRGRPRRRSIWRRWPCDAGHHAHETGGSRHPLHPVPRARLDAAAPARRRTRHRDGAGHDRHARLHLSARLLHGDVGGARPGGSSNARQAGAERNAERAARGRRRHDPGIDARRCAPDGRSAQARRRRRIR